MSRTALRGRTYIRVKVSSVLLTAAFHDPIALLFSTYSYRPVRDTRLHAALVPRRVFFPPLPCVSVPLVRLVVCMGVSVPLMRSLVRFWFSSAIVSVPLVRWWCGGMKL